jgi:uncharacterized damage-inducible protein DinB
MRDVLLARWSEVGDRVVELAAAVPESAYDVRPAPGARSFAEALRHLAFWNQYFRDVLRGASPDGSANELSAAAYPDREAVVAAVRESFDGVRRELARRDGAPLADADGDTVVSALEHAGEHYGQLAVYARLAGVVPPASRSDVTAGAV